MFIEMAFIILILGPKFGRLYEYMQFSIAVFVEYGDS